MLFVLLWFVLFRVLSFDVLCAVGVMCFVLCLCGCCGVLLWCNVSVCGVALCVVVVLCDAF